MLERASMARIDARAIVSELAKGLVAGDKPTIARLMIELHAALS